MCKHIWKLEKGFFFFFIEVNSITKHNPNSTMSIFVFGTDLLHVTSIRQKCHHVACLIFKGVGRFASSPTYTEILKWLSEWLATGRFYQYAAGLLSSAYVLSDNGPWFGITHVLCCTVYRKRPEISFYDLKYLILSYLILFHWHWAHHAIFPVQCTKEH